MNSIGKKASPFYALSTNGEIYFPINEHGNWTILYFYIGDFTSGSAMDIIELNAKVPKFTSYNSKILAISPDSVPSHIAWVLQLRNMDKEGKAIDIELISDSSLEISKMYGIVNSDTDMNLNEKAVLIIDPEGIVRSFHKFSHNMGINVTEIERELLSLQTAAYQFASTPAGWTPGDDVLEYDPRTVKSAQSAIPDRESRGLYCLDWYICYRADSGLRKPSQTI